MPLPPDAAAARMGRGRMFATVGIAVLTLAGTGALVGKAVRSAPAATWHAAAAPTDVASTEPAPSPTPSPSTSPITAAASYTIPGTHPRLPWPSHGQAAVDVQGLGHLGSSGGAKPVPIASVTKVMTAYVVLRDHPLTSTGAGPRITVTAAEAAAYPQEKASNESLVPVNAGEVLSERQALIALLLPSADNMARILARWDAGSTSAFVAKMNSAADSLGLDDTHYADPAGTTSATVSTAADQITLAEKAMKLPAFRAIVAMSSGTVPVAGTVHNYNTLLGHSGVIGIKTGSTTAAGGCLVFAATRTVNGHTLTIVGAVFGQSGTVMHGLPQALSASQRLITAAAGALHAYPLIKTGQQVGPGLYAARAGTVLGWPGLTYQASLGTDALTLTADTTSVTVPVGAG